MEFQQNYFELFQLPVGYGLVEADLSGRYLQLQKRIHPDNYAGNHASSQEQRLAVQWTAHINQAYVTLKDPLKRAIYLLQRSDVAVQPNPSLDPEFLLAQIELREMLETIAQQGDIALEQLMQFKRKVNRVITELQSEFQNQYPAQLVAAERTVYKMQFVTKLHNQALQLQEQLEEQLQ